MHFTAASDQQLSTGDGPRTAERTALQRSTGTSRAAAAATNARHLPDRLPTHHQPPSPVPEPLLPGPPPLRRKRPPTHLVPVTVSSSAVSFIQPIPFRHGASPARQRFLPPPKPPRSSPPISARDPPPRSMSLRAAPTIPATPRPPPPSERSERSAPRWRNCCCWCRRGPGGGGGGRRGYSVNPYPSDTRDRWTT